MAKIECSQCKADLGNPDSAATRKSFARVFGGPPVGAWRVLCLDCAHGGSPQRQGDTEALVPEILDVVEALLALVVERKELPGGVARICSICNCMDHHAEGCAVQLAIAVLAKAGREVEGG